MLLPVLANGRPDETDGVAEAANPPDALEGRFFAGGVVHGDGRPVGLGGIA
jgi:hypothetical protein